MSGFQYEEVLTEEGELTLSAYGLANFLYGLEKNIDEGYRIKSYNGAYSSSASLFGFYTIGMIKADKVYKRTKIFALPNGEVGDFETMSALENTKENRDFVCNLLDNHDIVVDRSKHRSIKSLVDYFEENFKEI